MYNLKIIFLAAFFSLMAPFAVFAADEANEFAADDYLSFSNANSPEALDGAEGLNRAFFKFNSALDSYLISPIADAYTYILPSQARTGIFNVLNNLEAPVVFVNSILQGDPQNSFVTFWRFIFNSTLGVAGLFDIATELGVPERNNEDFGQTLGVWGVGHGSYLVLPLLGPSSLRDAPAFVIDTLLNPFTYFMSDGELIAVTATRVIDTRSRYDRYIDQVYDTSLDPYATFRSLYLQRREASVKNFADADGVR